MKKVDVMAAYSSYERLSFGCSALCRERLGKYDLKCKCGRVWHTDCFAKYTNHVQSFVDKKNHITMCLCCNKKAFRKKWSIYSAKASLGCRRQPRRVRSCIEVAAIRAPKVVTTATNSTPPSKFCQNKSCEVRSRLVELSVKWTN